MDAARGLSHLAAVLSLRAEHAGTLDDAVEAADLARRAVAVAAPGSPVGLVALCTLSNALNVLAESSAVPVDHADVVELMREALERLPAGREHRQALLGQLADSLFLRARSSGSLPELGEAVTFARQAVRATDADDPFLTGRLSALGRSLDLQFAWTGDLNDADAGLDAGKAAVATLPSDHPELPKLLTNVAVGLAARFGRSQNPVDLDDAAEAARRAAAPADHANLGVRLTALANALDARFTLLGLPHSDEALDLRRRAVASVTADHPAYAMYLSNLGASLVEQGIVTGDKSTLREAVDVVRRAVDATPDGHPSQASRLYNLAMAHAAASRVSLVRGGYRKIMWQAVRVPTTPVMTRISLARRAGDHLVMLRLWREAAEALTYALDLAGQLVTRDLSRTAQQSRMEALDGLVADAVACWLRAGHERRAVAAFEQGRAVLASQVLDARTDLTDLAASHPRLAQRFEQLRNELDAVDATEAHKSPMTAAASPNLPEAMWATERAEANRRRQAATEFDVLLDEVRAMPGFERFMLRPNVDELLAAASAGPVVLINVSTHRSDALILTGNSVYVARLRGLTPESVRERVAEFRTALRATETDDDPGVAVEHGAEARIRGVLHWLWESIVRPVRRWLRWTTPPPQSGRAAGDLVVPLRAVVVPATARGRLPRPGRPVVAEHRVGPDGVLVHTERPGAGPCPVADGDGHVRGRTQEGSDSGGRQTPAGCGHAADPVRRRPALGATGGAGATADLSRGRDRAGPATADPAGCSRRVAPPRLGALCLSCLQRPGRPVCESVAAARPPAWSTHRGGRGEAQADDTWPGIPFRVLRRAARGTAAGRGDSPGVGLPACRLPACDRGAVAARRRPGSRGHRAGVRDAGQNWHAQRRRCRAGSSRRGSAVTRRTS